MLEPADKAAAFPPGLRLGRGHQRLPDRRRGRATTARARRSGTTSAACPAPSPTAATATSPATTTTGWRGPGPDRRPGRRCLPLLGRPGRVCSPRGKAPGTRSGLDFYERLVDGLLARGIKPYLTLNHWDLPQALQAAAAGRTRDTVHRFVDYACGMAARGWATAGRHHHPQRALGHRHPGPRDRRVRPGREEPRAGHAGRRTTCCSATAWRCRRCARRAARRRLGIVLNLSPTSRPPTAEPTTPQARLDDGRLVRWYMDPLFKGRYPADVLEHLGADAPRGASRRHGADRHADGLPGRQLLHAPRGQRRRRRCDASDSGLPLTDMGWEIYPQGLTELLLRLHRDYPLPPMYVTENGAAFKDDAGRTAACTTRERTDYIAGHIAAVGDALRAGRAAWPATWCGACWTTSSGPRATPSASASCTSTTPRSSAR